MSKVLTFFVGCLLVLHVGAQTVIQDPNAQLRAVKGYHGIRVSNAIDVYLSQGQDEKVVVSARDQDVRNKVETSVVDGILIIRLEQPQKWWKWWGSRNQKVKAYVSYTTLDEIGASGASNVYVDGVISGDRLSLGLSGASDFKGAVKVNTLTIHQSGASDSHITGQVSGTATIDLSGASDVKGYDLVVEQCSARASGASDVQITVNKQLDAFCSGASGVYYKGPGMIRESHTSGASNVGHTN